MFDLGFCALLRANTYFKTNPLLHWSPSIVGVGERMKDALQGKSLNTYFLFKKKIHRNSRRHCAKIFWDEPNTDIRCCLLNKCANGGILGRALDSNCIGEHIQGILTWPARNVIHFTFIRSRITSHARVEALCTLRYYFLNSSTNSRLRVHRLLVTVYTIFMIWYFC